MTNEEAADILYDWNYWARPKQLEPEGDWLTWLILTGRAWGKTRTAAEWVISKARKKAKHIALIGQTVADVRDTMIKIGPSSILKISRPDFMPEYTPSNRTLIWPNGVVATTYSGDNPDQVRGPSHDIVWIDELAKFRYPDDIWSNLRFGLREGEDMRILVTTTPRPIRLIKSLVNDPDTIVVRGSTYENKDNLPDKYFDYVITPYIGTRLGQQEIEGKILGDNPNALWSRAILDKNRVAKYPELIRIVVAVDPGIKSTKEETEDEEPAETGIIVAGLGSDKHGYVLADCSLVGSPDKWGKQVVAAFYQYKADRVVAEINQGGEMVEYVIHSIDKDIPFKGVHASRGKYVRAEPISALDEQGRIHHVGNFIDMEDQLCEWVPGEKSPDRLDARVWGFTELMLEEQGRPQVRAL